MVFNTLYSTDHMFESLPSSSFVEHPLTDECNFSKVNVSKQNMVSNRQENSTNGIYQVPNRYHRLKSSSSNENLTSKTVPCHQSVDDIEQSKLIHTDEQNIDPLWQSTGIKNNLLFYSIVIYKIQENQYFSFS